MDGKFKLGDIVRFIGNTNHSDNSIGDIGTIIEYSKGFNTYRVQVPNGSHDSNWTLEGEMELINVVLDSYYSL